MTDPDDPTRIYRPVSPEPDAGPPTEAFQRPAPGGAGFPPAEPPPAGPSPGGPSGGGGARTEPWIVGLLALIALLAVAIVILLVVDRGGHTSATSGGSGTTAAQTTSTGGPVTTAPTTTAVPVTLPPLPTTEAAPTTTTTSSSAAGNRAPTAAEAQQIAADAPPPPNGQIDLIRIANSDSTWAVDHVSPTAGHQGDFQAGYNVLHLQGGTWKTVASGTAQVDCGGSVPSNVVADFASILGSC